MTQKKKPEPRFTPYILDVKKDTKIYPPLPELLSAIADALYNEMKKRNLWDKSPSWLDCAGDKWKKDSEEFKQLVNFFYGKSILNRLTSLKARAKKGQNIDNYVIRNIKNDLTREQQKWDKVGHAVYENLNFAIFSLIEVGIIEIYRRFRNWQTKIDQQTLLAFSSSYSTTLADDQLMFEALGKNTLFRDVSLLIKLGKKDKQLEEPLCEMIYQLKKSGVNHFQFSSLIEPVKKYVRIARTKIESEGDDDNDRSEDNVVNIPEPDEIYLSEFCDEIRCVIKRLKRKYWLRHKRFYGILKARQEAIEQQITPLSLEDLARRFGVSVNIEERKQKEWARRLNISIEQFNEARSLEELSGSRYETNNAIKKPFLTEEKARILGISVEKLEKAIKQNIEIPSHQKLAKLLKCASGTINTDIKILRELARQVKKEKDWEKATLVLVAKMLK